MSTSASDNRASARFFGKVSASVSHEIKNVFAVINEAAGLIEDFTIMAEKGMPIEPKKLKRVANSIQGQVQRGDAIVKNINALAHSTDEDAKKVDLITVLELTLSLAMRMADMKQMKLEMGECESASTVIDQFGLIQVLYKAIAQTLELMAPSATLIMSITTDETDAIISYVVPDQDIALKLDDAVLDLAQQLNISIQNNTVNGSLDLRLKRVD